jgi:hypothetical protein
VRITLTERPYLAQRILVRAGIHQKLDDGNVASLNRSYQGRVLQLHMRSSNTLTDHMLDMESGE